MTEKPSVTGDLQPRRQLMQSLGLAKKAGFAIAGSDAVMSAIRGKEAKIVFLAKDAGSNTSKKYHDKCAFYGISLYDCLTADELGRAIGRAHSAVVAVTDPGFAAKMARRAGEISGGEAF